MLALVLVSLASGPWFWARSIERRVCTSLKERHKNEWAVIGMHVDGAPGRHLNLYDKLWSHIVYRLTVSTDPSAIPYSNHHCAVLVSDNTQVYRYYWSLRHGELILDGAGVIARMADVSQQASYHFAPGDLRVDAGIPWHKRALRGNDDVYWYFPEGGGVESPRLSPTPEAELQP